MLILPEVSQLRDVFQEVEEAGEGQHLVAVEAGVVEVLHRVVLVVEVGVVEVLHWAVLVVEVGVVLILPRLIRMTLRIGEALLVWRLGDRPSLFVSRQLGKLA